MKKSFLIALILILITAIVLGNFKTSENFQEAIGTTPRVINPSTIITAAPTTRAPTAAPTAAPTTTSNPLTKDNFDWKAYVSNYGDLQKAGIDTLDEAWAHYISNGKREGRTATILKVQPGATAAPTTIRAPTTTGAPIRLPTTTGAPIRLPTTRAPTTPYSQTTTPAKIFEKQIFLTDLKDIKFELIGYNKRIDNIAHNLKDMDMESKKHRNEMRQHIRLDLIEPTKKIYQTLLKDYRGLNNRDM